MIKNIGIKRRIAAVILTVGMVFSPLSLQLPSYAAPVDETAEFGELSPSENTSEKAEQGTVLEVEGEAIVCFRQDEKATSQKEEVVKDAQEKEIEVESYVDEAEALLMVESPEADLAAAETDTAADTAAETETASDTAEEAEGSDDAAPAKAPSAVSVSGDERDLASELPGVITVVHSDHLSTAELIAELEEREDVIYAEPNYIYSPKGEDLTDDQWGNPTSSSYGMGIEDLNSYEDEKPNPKVDTSGLVVAVIDTGVDYKHEDLADVMWSDGENYEELVTLGGGKYGYNGTKENSEEVPYNSADPMDDNKHGTHCAGIIAAAWNGYGVSGVTSGAKIMAIKASNELGMFPSDAVIRSYNYMITAKKAGVNICASNNSYGGGAGSQTEILLVAEAGKNGIVCCFAAGNSGEDLDYANSSAPLRESVPQAVMVGASNALGHITDFSNYGRRDVDVFAPGENILSTVPMGTGTPTASSGTFMDGETPCDVDYSEKTEPGDDVMDITPVGGTEAAVQNGEDGKNVLHLTSEDGKFWLNTKVFDDLDDLKGAFFRVYVDGQYSVLIQAGELDTEGNIGDRIGYTEFQTKAGWNDIGFSFLSEFTERAGKKNTGVGLAIAVLRGSITDYELLHEVDIRTIRLTEEGGNYELMNGTSMAAPYVTGGVAVLAAAFPGDSAEKLAARVRGSVLPVSEMEDKCLSGGIFRLDKALAGDTAPVVKLASTEGNSVRVKGFFFGEDQGTVRVGGKNCTVSSWSDEEIVAVLPEDIPDGEARVDITSTAGQKGHNWFNYSKPKEQYDSLPLPGIPISDTGMYVVDQEAKETYKDFYYGTPFTMTALGGSLYVFFVTEKNGTVIYRYQITDQNWERIYSTDEYNPKGAICTWNGKVLFLAQNDEKKTNVIGALDPKTKGVEWTVYRDDLIEDCVQMVNTGAAIYILGGRERTGLDPAKQPKITTLRKLDPETMKISVVSGEDFSFTGDYPLLAAVSKETFYAYAKSDTDASGGLGLFKITVDQEGSKGVVMEPVEFGKDVAGALEGLSMDLGLYGVATKQGYITLGPIRVDEEGRIVEDNFLVGYDGQSFVAEKKIISQRPVYMLIATGYNGKVYVFGMTKGTDAGCTFTAIDAETIPVNEGEELADHRWDEGTVTKAAACTKNGVRTYTCIDCGKTKTETIKKTGHKPVTIPGVPATEKKAGKTEGRKCSVCGEILVAQKTVPKLVLNGWKTVGGKKYYYVNDRKTVGFKIIDGKKYYFNKKGVMKTGWLKDGKNWYYLKKNGVMKTGWLKDGKNWYYLGKKGVMKTGWLKDGKNWYYLKKNGAMKTGWLKDGKNWYYLKKNGAMKTGWLKVGRKWYHMDKKGVCLNP